MLSNTGILDTICGYIYRDITEMGKCLVLGAVSFGVLGYVYGIVASWKDLILALTTAYEQLKENDFNHSFLNIYVNHVNHVLKEILKTLKKMKEDIKELKKQANDKDDDINESVNDIVTEGFTKDVSKTYRTSFNNANAKIKEAKKFMKDGEYIEARVSIRQARKEVVNAQNQINEMGKNTDLSDHIIGKIYGGLVSTTKALVFAIPTFGVSIAVEGVKNLYLSCNKYYEQIKNKEKLDFSAENTYLNHVNHVLDEVIRTLKKLEAEIDKKESGSSSSDDKPNKKKILNKKDKNMNESTSLKVLLASDLLADMDDLF